jgi:hypothetical protein
MTVVIAIAFVAGIFTGVVITLAVALAADGVRQ